MKNFLLTLGLVITTTVGFGQLIGKEEYRSVINDVSNRNQVKFWCSQRDADYYLDDILFNYILRYDTLTFAELNALNPEAKKKVFERYLRCLVTDIIREAQMYRDCGIYYTAKAFAPDDMRIMWSRTEKKYDIYLTGWAQYEPYEFVRSSETLHLDIDGNVFISYPSHDYVSWTRDYYPLKKPKSK